MPTLKSLARVNADGSPLELALAANAGAANFSGRLSTAKVLSLAGPVSLSSHDPAPACGSSACRCPTAPR